jgi:cytochrome oxidase Cu insertion factor (SCO1/SenC/PrrC family)
MTEHDIRRAAALWNIVRESLARLQALADDKNTRIADLEAKLEKVRAWADKYGVFREYRDELDAILDGKEQP